MKKIYILIFSMMFLVNFAGNIEKSSIITKDLKQHLDQKSDNELVRINIRFKEQLNLSTRMTQLKEMSMDVRREYVVNELKQFSKETQKDLSAFLEQHSAQDFKPVMELWISNVITCYASESLIDQLALRTDIDRIDIDETRQVIAVAPEPKPFAPADKGVDEITYNVLKVNADDVWDLGYTGEGIIVSVIDAGVNYNHLDLEDHMWESTDYPNHGYDFRNNDNDPMDGHGHGTHCAGTVAGDGTAGSQTGMAPDASIMACKVLGDDGSGEESYVWEAIEFSVEQGAHVISMSLGWQHSWNPDRPTWRNTLDNALAAGLVASIAAGNEGGSINNPDDVRTPGDCPPPWLNPDQTLVGGISAVVCVGATNSSDGIASFSSRGPSTWETVDPFNDYPFNPELGLLRPDVSAPGVDVKSCRHNSNTGYTTMSGTSMATPGVAGVMALLLSKNPGLSPEEICMILETTALDLGVTGKDNVYGAGRIDAFEAVENTSEQGPVYSAHTLNDSNGNGEIEAGESVQLSITMFNGSDFDYSNVDVTISCESNYITITDDQENYGEMNVDESVEVIDGFAFDISDNLPGMMGIRFNVSATDGTEVWESSFTIISFGPNLSIGDLMIDDASGNNNGRLDPGETANVMIAIHNTGQFAAENILISLASGGSYLTFTNTEVNIDALAADSETEVSFQVIVGSDVPEGAAEAINVDLLSGAFTDTKEYVLIIGLIVEDWETGGFDLYDWSFSGGDWIITDLDPYEGIYCSESASIGDNGTTSMLLDYEAGGDGTISFYKKVSSEGNYDMLKFYIDGAQQGEWSGDIAWSLEEYDVSAGSHTFKWEYSKDGSVSTGADAAWVDFIVLPPPSLPSIILDADASICDNEEYMSEAEAENYDSLLWSTSGDGTFDDAEILDAIYTPGTNDILNGSVQLMLTANGANGNVNAMVNLAIYPIVIETPAAPLGQPVLCVNAGNETYTSAVAAGEVLIWTLSPVEAGEITSAADTAVVVWGEDYIGEAMISVHIIGVCAESDESEPIVVTVNALPLVSIAGDVDGCFGQNIEISAELTGAAPWIISIVDAGEITADENTYTFSWEAVQDSSFTIDMLTDANGCINTEMHQVDITVNDSPIVNIGNDTILCMISEITLSAANDGATYEWSTGETSQEIVVDSTDLNGASEKQITVLVTNEYDCAMEDQILISFQDCSGIGELLSIENLKVYPNPNHGIFEISLNSLTNQDVNVEIRNMMGAVVYEESLKLEHGNMIHSIDISDLAAQAYLLIIKTQDGQMVQRLIVE